MRFRDIVEQEKDENETINDGIKEYEEDAKNEQRERVLELYDYINCCRDSFELPTMDGDDLDILICALDEYLEKMK